MKKISSIIRPIVPILSAEELKANLATHNFASLNANAPCTGCGHKPWSREVRYSCGSGISYQQETVWRDGTTSIKETK